MNLNDKKKTRLASVVMAADSSEGDALANLLGSEKVDPNARFEIAGHVVDNDQAESILNARLPVGTPIYVLAGTLSDLRPAHLSEDNNGTGCVVLGNATIPLFTDREASEFWLCVRVHNQSIPSESLDSMLEVLNSTPGEPPAHVFYRKEHASEAWACVRKHNHSIPDASLDAMHAALLAVFND